jgi:hypothetical protein
MGALILASVLDRSVMQYGTPSSRLVAFVHPQHWPIQIVGIEPDRGRKKTHR